MKLPIFLSCPKPYLNRQEQFLATVEAALEAEDLSGLTLGRSDYDMSAPLIAIRRMMAGCCGLLAIAFRRTHLVSAVDRPASDRGEPERLLKGEWLTSAYCQIEPAMAFQLGLPILIWREAGVVADGLLDRGALGLSMPAFNLDAPPDLSATEWRQPLRQWIDQVRLVYEKRGNPMKLW